MPAARRGCARPCLASLRGGCLHLLVLLLALEALAWLPMVLVRGGLSDLLSEETVRQMGARNPEMTLVTVPRVGHAPTLDEPEALAAIDTWLSELA